MRLARRRDKFLDQFQDRPSTHEAYKRRLDQFVEWMEGKTLIKEVTSEWIEDLKIDLGGTSVQLHYRTIKQFLSWMFEMGYLSSVPLPKLTIGRIDEVEKIPITKEEHSRIISASNGIWTYACEVAWATGFRLSDVALLGKTDVMLASMTVTRLTKKRGKRVEIPVPKNVIVILSKEANRSDTDFICDDMAREYLANQHHNLSTQFIRLAQKAGVNKSFHCYRHAFVTRLLENGADSLMISKMTGISIRQILTYAHPSLDSMRKALAI